MGYIDSTTARISLRDVHQVGRLVIEVMTMFVRPDPNASTRPISKRKLALGINLLALGSLGSMATIFLRPHPLSTEQWVGIGLYGVLFVTVLASTVAILLGRTRWLSRFVRRR